MRGITRFDWPLTALAARLMARSGVGAFRVTHFDHPNGGLSRRRKLEQRDADAVPA